MSENETPQNNQTVVDAPTCCYTGPKCKLWIPLLIILILIILGLAIGKGEFFNMLFSGIKLKNSEPYQKALQAVQADSKTIEKLGEPIEANGWPAGSLTDTDCNIFFDVTGPNGTGKVVVEGRASDRNVWSFRKLEVTFDEGEPIQIETEEQEGSLEKAPTWPQ